ncbi:MAG: glutathione S-transferase [Alphaproteobacteria bacterium]|nr:glutathione S-transferase [Alphaproteobacteria bacterium]MBV8407062.1 glutathione S-transferase [Alphaproteobacteria bacterium]
MLFHDCTTAPSPRRVRIFLAEKGVRVPTVQVDLRNGEHLGEAFLAVNPEGTVPVLELDGGQRLYDIVGICRYFEETVPQPALFGTSALEKAMVDSWLRWSDREGFYAVMDAFRNSTRGLKDRALPGSQSYPQIPELAQRSKLRIADFFGRLDDRLGSSEFLAGPSFSIADITAMVSIDFAAWMKIVPSAEQAHLQRWLAAVRSRPSSQA